MTSILKPEGDWLSKVEEFFNNDEPVALPTETVYGLAAPISRPKAIAKIFDLKNRPTFNPLIVHLKKDWDIFNWVEKLTDVESRLIEKFWPGPLSLVLPKKNIPDICTASSKLVVLRAPKNKIFEQVLDGYGVPLAAPSANTSTRLSPTTAIRVQEDLGERGLKAIVDGGRSSEGLESTIVQVVNEKLRILREGALSDEELVLAGFELDQGYQQSQVASASGDVMPGQGKHYAPLVPLVVMDDPQKWVSYHSNKKLLFLKILESDAPGLKPFNQKAQFVVLSQNDLKEAAFELFETLRLAETEVEQIVVLKTKDIGLGRAINDRLRRANG